MDHLDHVETGRRLLSQLDGHLHLIRVVAESQTRRHEPGGALDHLHLEGGVRTLGSLFRTLYVDHSLAKIVLELLIFLVVHRETGAGLDFNRERLLLHQGFVESRL